MPQSNNERRNAQQGNVFLIILIGVVLFGALGFTFSRSANKGTGNLTKQQAKIAAQEILNYARLVEGAVDRVRRNGCSESEISFENNVVSGYTNANSPIDKSCHVFDDNGGKIEYLEKPKSIKQDIVKNDFSFNTAALDRAIPDIGFTNKADLFLVLRFRNSEYAVCEEINKMVGIKKTGTAPLGHFDPSDPGNMGWANALFVGAFPEPIASYVSNTAVHGKNTFCTGTVEPSFNHVLLAR